MPFLQSAFEEFLRPLVSIFAHGTSQAGAVRRRSTFFHSVQHFVLGLGELAQIVDEVDEQKLLRQRSGKTQLRAESEFATTQLEVAMPLVVIDDGLVIELRRTDAQAVVGI